ncbi:MAG: T9SS type A sorting domain-containing protein [Saprospiraceae bacterium]
MKKILIGPALIASAFLILANPNDPPNGRTGAPGEPTCASCHSIGSGTQDGIVTVDGLPASIEPCTAYVLTITSTNPNGVAVKAGFQITLLNSLNQRAGLFTSAGSGAQIQPLNPSASERQYCEQSTPSNYPASHSVSWTVTWKSPSSPSNTTISYYVANLVANGNGSSSGDLTLTGTGEGMLNGGASTLTVSITSSNNILCNGQTNGSATAGQTGGLGPYGFNWSNGSSGQTINNLAAGTYTVTVTDNCSASATASVTISQPPALSFSSPTITNVSCNGGNNGAITAHTSGGVGPYSFNWSNGFSGPTISNLPAGAYTVTVSDNNDCTKTSIVQVTQPAVIAITLVNLTNESCSGDADGAITISVIGGANPLVADWSNGLSGLSINNLNPGNFIVTVSDNNGCTKTSNYTINSGAIVNLTLNQIQNVTCGGGMNGSISVTANGGMVPYIYTWSNGGTGAMISGLAAGSYIVTATDNRGCHITKTYSVTQPQPVEVQINQGSQNLCFGNSMAVLTSIPVGGTPPYTYAWSNGVIGSTNSNVPAGTYIVTVTDDHGCSATKTSMITDPPLVILNVASTDVTGVGLDNGTATATPSGGTGTFTYVWNTGAATSMITGLGPGLYSVTVADMNSCSSSGSAQINPFNCLLNVFLPQDSIFCGVDSLLLVPFVTGASGSLNYFWTGGLITDSLMVNLTGEYCVTVTDEAGCQASDCIMVTLSPQPSFDCFIVNETSPGAMDGSVQCNGDFDEVYIWNMGMNTQSIFGLSPGVYCVTATNSDGCVNDTCFNVQPGNCELTISSSLTNVVCAGDSTGSIIITTTNFTSPVLYGWSNGDTSAIISNLPIGSYSVTVTDATGCFATDHFTITEPGPIQIMIDSTSNITDCCQGSISITVTGIISPYEAVLFNQDTSFHFNGLSGIEQNFSLSLPGYYSLTLIGANGCDVNVDSILIELKTTGTKDPAYTSVKVYPVPSEDVLFIDLNHPIAEVIITGIDGRMCKKIHHPLSNRINVSELEAGWYYIRISDGTSWYVARIIK